MSAGVEDDRWPTGAGDEPEHRTRRVLVVDDEDLVRLVIASILRRAGLDVIEARDGLEALAQVRTSAADLILTDLNMPRCDGEQLCVELKGDQQTAHIPIILMTGGPTDEAKMRGLGCAAFLYKPLHVSMTDSVWALLRRTA